MVLNQLLPGMLAIVLPLLASPALAQSYRQTNLLTDNQANLAQDGLAPAAFTDPNLVNPWGISYAPTGPFWISDNGTGVSTLNNGAGQPIPLVVKIPSPSGATSTPTGQIFNTTNDFKVDNTNKSNFIFATEDGTISGWNPNFKPDAVIKVDNSASGAVYKGLAFSSSTSGNFLYAANFNAGNIDVFDSSFKSTNLTGSFSDSSISPGFAPFNIQNLGGKLYVTYAKQNAAKHDDVAGAGNGFVDVFDTNGNFFQRLTANGSLNSPWGVALAPANFGQFSNDLLVGNFGDGRISAFNPNTGNFDGQLSDINGNPITIDGLWGLTFGNGANAGATDTLYFSAGINGEQHGLFGSLQPVPEPDEVLGTLGLGVCGMVWQVKRQLKKPSAV